MRRRATRSASRISSGLFRERRSSNTRVSSGEEVLHHVQLVHTDLDLVYSKVNSSPSPNILPSICPTSLFAEAAVHGYILQYSIESRLCGTGRPFLPSSQSLSPVAPTKHTGRSHECMQICPNPASFALTSAVRTSQPATAAAIIVSRPRTKISTNRRN